MKFFLTVIICIGIYSFTFSQDTLTLLNGKQKLIESFKFEDDSLVVECGIAKGKTKRYDTDEIFSISGEETSPLFFYKKDEQGNLLNISEMQWYIKGMVDAQNNHKSPFDLWGGYAVGLAAPFITRSFVNPLIPLTYSFTVGLAIPSSKKYKKKYLQGKNEMYQKGFLEVRRKKRITRNLSGGTLGFATGLLITFLAK